MNNGQLGRDMSGIPTHYRQRSQLLVAARARASKNWETAPHGPSAVRKDCAVVRPHPTLPAQRACIRREDRDPRIRSAHSHLAQIFVRVRQPPRSDARTLRVGRGGNPLAAQPA
ncbi:hypothetical protein GCM10010222_54350 [Streptomyces tanashiensis]|nr:hypothetical protein GCM10010222_54350 [Streptomyces tanashiensis]